METKQACNKTIKLKNINVPKYVYLGRSLASDFNLQILKFFKFV